MSLQLSSEQSVDDVWMRSWTGREFRTRGPAAAKVVVVVVVVVVFIQSCGHKTKWRNTKFDSIIRNGMGVKMSSVLDGNGNGRE